MKLQQLDTSTCRIAVVEDTATTRRIIERLLVSHFHCHISSYATPDELWPDCENNPPDLFLIDVVLDKKSGIDVCRVLKNNDITRNIPVIFLSEHSQPQTRIDALRAGGVDYVDKPFYPGELLQRIQGCLERFFRQKELLNQTQEQMALLRVLCHDLRNSVGAAMNMLQLLSATDLDEERHLYLDIGNRAARSALELIAHVGEYRSLLDSKTPLKTEPVNLAAACDEALNLVTSVAGAKNIRLEKRIPPELVLRCNRVVLVHNIITNLLTNAIKFSPSGAGIYIEASPETVSGGPGCHITVRDEGIGIPPDILKSLLKKQLVSSRQGTANEEGTGIGMTLVQLYVERGGGTITIESTTADPENPSVKSGTCIHLYFPAEAAVISKVA